MQTTHDTPRKKSRPRSKDYDLAIIKYDPADVEQFNRGWESWPRTGWNFSSKSEAPRRLNYNNALERFMDILRYSDIEIDEHRMTSEDLANIMIHYAERVKRSSHGNPPVCCCIENFLSCVAGEKHPWKEEVLYMSGFVK